MKHTFYSNGKLLITGEYLVLDGAKSFALPTKFGQDLIIEKTNTNSIHWTSYDNDKSIWFTDTILFSEIITIDNDLTDVRATLLKILHEGYILNPSFINEGTGYKISTQLSFPRKWGLGTSSTLINNIAQWLHIDAFELLNKSFGGSGYDIACAQNNSPITYQLQQQKPIVEKVTFNPEFIKHIYFVYLNKKQNSKTAIANYQNNKSALLENNIETINALTSRILNANTLVEFDTALEKHETEMSHILKTTTIKETLFADFTGQVKSLGAWGGDFVMATSIKNPKGYFASKGFTTIVPYCEMILI